MSPQKSSFSLAHFDADWGALYKKLRFVNVRNVGTNLRGWYVSWCNFPAKPEIRTHVSYVSKRNFLYNAPLYSFDHKNIVYYSIIRLDFY